MVTRILAAGLLAGAVLGSTPALAQEVLTVPFNVVDTATAGSYDGQVRITVSGIGQSDATIFNDAFYLLNGATTSDDPGYYKLGFSTSTLQSGDAANAAYNYIPGGAPAYSPTNTYTFLLNTGLATPGQLHFGVTDGVFEDNTGSFTLSITSVPEPATWAMMVLGFGMVGFGLRYRRTRQSVRVKIG